MLDPDPAENGPYPHPWYLPTFRYRYLLLKGVCLIDGLAGDAGRGVEVGVANGVGVGVGNPGHLPLAGAHVRSGHINAGSQESYTQSTWRYLLRYLDVA